MKNEVQVQGEELAIELDEHGMVVLKDPELLKLVAGGMPGGSGGGTGIGGNYYCGLKRF